MANVNPWDSNAPVVGGNNRRGETATDDTSSNMYGSQETILFLVDMSKQMFQKNNWLRKISNELKNIFQKNI